MQIRYFEEFIDFATDLNFSAAARRQNLSLSAFSTHISTIEKEVGVPLITRGHACKLTPAGIEFLERAHRFVSLWQETLNSCAQAAASTSAILRFDAATIYYDYEVNALRIARDLSTRNPNFKLKLTNLKTGSLLSALKEDAVDAGFITRLSESPQKSFEEGGYSYVLAGSEPAAVWISNRSPLAAMETISIEDLAGYRFIIRMNLRKDTRSQSISSFFTERNLRAQFSFKYAEAPEDLFLEGLEDDEVFLGTPTAFKKFLAFSLADDRQVKMIDPAVYLASYICYRTDSDNPALKLFIEQLENAKANA